MRELELSSRLSGRNAVCIARQAIDSQPASEVLHSSLVLPLMVRVTWKTSTEPFGTSRLASELFWGDRLPFCIAHYYTEVDYHTLR